MQLECVFCNKRLNIPPTAKLPVGKPFTFTCPACGRKNTVTLDQDAAQGPAGAPMPNAPDQQAMGNPMGEQPFGGPAPQGPPMGPGGGGHRPPGDTSFREAGPPTPGYSVAEAQRLLELNDLTAEAEKPALIIFDKEEVQDFLNEKLTSMGYRVILALNVRDAAKQLKFGRFKVVLLQEDYYGATLRSNQLLKALTTLELSVRRKMFIGLVGPNFTSLDDLMAFSLSMDTVINSNDLDDIERILISATGHVSKFFATYDELRLARGVD
ncbi:MAG: hypothetical protein LBF40_03265 [Deltaproteobacteria bacterium]|jgi:hypothetical protein|nr:hypothetical protein [Deltaproteobacteria bacterium]